MKHYLNITFPITSEFIKDYTITDAENILWKDYNIDNKSIPLYHIFITEDAYKKYESENKIYYMHYYNHEFYLDCMSKISTSAIMKVLFLYMSDEKEYHLCTIFNDKENTHLIDITARLKNNFSYWKEYYIPHDFSSSDIPNNFTGNMMSTVYFYDNNSECVIDAFKYFKNVAVKQSTLSNTEYIILNTDYTYERTFNKIYEERIKDLKESITKELEERKNSAYEDVTKYNKIIQKITELENEYKGNSHEFN